MNTFRQNVHLHSSKYSKRQKEIQRRNIYVVSVDS